MTSPPEPTVAATKLTARRKVILGGCAVVAAGGIWFVRDVARESTAEAAAALALRKNIEAKGGFVVIGDALQKRVGPSVVLPERPVALTDLGAQRLGPFQSLGDALPPYPAGFVKRFIDTVALADKIVFWSDTIVGGFFFPRGICINVGTWSTATKDLSTVTFHHELSSLVRLAAPFDDARWMAFNPPGFDYLDEAAYRRLIREAPRAAGDSALHEKGFTRPYGQSSVDDDWNTYAEEVFGHGAAFAALIAPFPRMRGKTAIMLDWYQELDAGFAPFFEATGLRAAVSVRP